MGILRAELLRHPRVVVHGPCSEFLPRIQVLIRACLQSLHVGWTQANSRSARVCLRGIPGAPALRRITAMSSSFWVCPEDSKFNDFPNYNKSLECKTKLRSCPGLNRGLQKALLQNLACSKFKSAMAQRAAEEKILLPLHYTTEIFFDARL